MEQLNIGDKFILGNNVIGTLVSFDKFGPFLTLSSTQGYYRNDNGYFRFSVEFLMRQEKVGSFKFLK